MSAFGLFDAKNRFSELVGRAMAGEDVVVTRHGRPVARIVPYDNPDETEARAKAHRKSLARLASLREASPLRMSDHEIVAARRLARSR